MYMKLKMSIICPTAVGIHSISIELFIFFNVFIDDMSCALRDIDIGCFIGNVCLNHADDMVLLASSPCALQQLLNVCYNYAFVQYQKDQMYNIIFQIT